MMSQTICTRCVIDTTVPGATFDEHGVCNYCHLHEALEREWPMGETGQQKLESLVDQIKARGKGKPYDCIVGVSGGTDSTYTLYLAKQLGLRPLAVYFDNSWSTETSVSNIKNALSKLDIDLYTYVVDWEEFKDLQMAYLKAALPWADAPTDLGIIATLYRTAAEEGIKYILIGQSFRTEGRMPDEWSYYDGKTVKYIHKKFGTKPIKSFPNLMMFDFIRFQFIKRIQLIKPLNYIAYSKPKAREILHKKVGWEYYGGHHHENIYTRFAYSFWLPQKFGIDKRKITHSALVRSDQMSRAEALKIVQAPHLPSNKLEEDVEYVIKKLGFSEEEFAEIVALPPRSFKDYPSYYPIYEHFRPVYTLLFRLLFPKTSPIYLQTETRHK